VNNSNIISIVILRALAALMVCVIHIGMITGFHTTRIIQTFIDAGQSGVSVFFVISGFILPLSLFKRNYLLKDFWTFLLGRMIRIDPPYWVSILIVFLIGLQPLAIISTKSLLLHITYLVPFFTNANWYNGVYWTLAIEFQYYIIIGIAYPILIRLKPGYTLCAVILPSMVCILLKLNLRGIIVTDLYNFTIGFIVFLGFVKRINKITMIIVLLSFACFVMAFVSIKTGAIPLMTAMVIAFYKKQSVFNPILLIGNISYSLYLIHIPVSVLLVNLLKGAITNSLLMFSFCLIFSIMCSYAFYLAIEKPSINLSKRYKYRYKSLLTQRV
jgi:peptidoglycan/LPS O-acetylase OafA/YrhL